MSSSKKILEKIRILIAHHFETPEAAFNFFDKDSDSRLDKDELTKLLKEAEISGFIRGIVAKKLIERYDASQDQSIDWEEFKLAYADLTKED